MPKGKKQEDQSRRKATKVFTGIMLYVFLSVIAMAALTTTVISQRGATANLQEKVELREKEINQLIDYCDMDVKVIEIKNHEKEN